MLNRELENIPYLLDNLAEQLFPDDMLGYPLKDDGLNIELPDDWSEAIFTEFFNDIGRKLAEKWGYHYTDIGFLPSSKRRICN